MLVRRNTVRIIQRGMPKRMPTCWALQDKWVMPCEVLLLLGDFGAGFLWPSQVSYWNRNRALLDMLRGFKHHLEPNIVVEKKNLIACASQVWGVQAQQSTRNSVQSGNCIIIWSSLSTQIAVILDDAVGGQGIKLEFQHTFIFVLFPLDQMGLAILIFLCLAVCRLLSALMLIDLRQNLWTLVTSILCSWYHLLSKELTWSHDSPSVLLRSFCL
jgi:hypothetical protein